MTTPEGKIKRKVTELLRSYNIYYFMPVQSGLGSTTLDYLCCIGGSFVAIETKREGGKPTPRQETVIQDICGANGLVFVIRNEDELKILKRYLDAHTQERPIPQPGWTRSDIGWDGK